MCSSLLDHRLTTHISTVVHGHCNCRSIATDNDDDEVIKDSNNYCSANGDGKILNSAACSAYVEKLCRSGDLSDAVSMLRHLHDEQIRISLNSFNILLQQAGEANNFVVFAKIFKYLLLSRLPPDSTSYMNIAKALQKVDDSKLITKFIREVSEITHGRDCTVMNRIIFATAKYGLTDKSLMIFDELKKDQSNLDIVTFNTILDILGRVGRMDQMLCEYRLMKDLGHSPDIVTYNTIINCLRRLGKLDLCKSFAIEMFERGIDLDLRTYTALIDGFGRAGHIKDALEMFDRLKRSHRPSIYVYRALISDIKKAGNIELAAKLSEEMKSCYSELLGPEDFKQKLKGRRIRKQGG